MRLRMPVLRENRHKMKLKRILFHILIFSVMVVGTTVIHGCGPSDNAGNCCGQRAEDNIIAGENMATSGNNSAVVTFIELGSMNCIPCKKMQPVMDSIEKRYGSRINVIFYNVMTPEGRPFAEKYRIRVIPTQIFLDTDGKQFFRHEGFLPEKEIVRMLTRRGIVL